MKFLKSYFVSLCLCTASLIADSKNEKPTLATYRANVYSQFGEDGVLAKILEIIGTNSKLCIEFGAWDGFYLSNTANLWGNQDWSAVLIEQDPERCKTLFKNTKMYKKVQSICASVGIGKSDSLEAILNRNSIDYSEVDVLCIDIDNDDYYVFQSLEIIRPRVIICEYNPTMPAHLDIYPEYGKYMGASPGALIRIAKEKGYELVALTTCNCFFVLKEDLYKFDNHEISLEKIRMDNHLRYVITDYAGRYAIVSAKQYIGGYGLYTPMNDKINGNIQVINK